MRVPLNDVVDSSPSLASGRRIRDTASIHLTLIISPTGDVISATTKSPKGETIDLATLPKLDAIVRQWKYVPFTQDGKAVTAQIEAGLSIEPPERMPSAHVAAPVLRPESKVTITLRRTACFGTCPEYSVAISTDGIVFKGTKFVVAPGEHRETVSAEAVRKLAEKYVAEDFYSTDSGYGRMMMDAASSEISIEIDGRKKSMTETGGSWGGTPAMILDLEDEADAFARTDRWIKGGDGLVAALHAEGYDFKTYDAQILLKRAAENSQAATVREFLAAGVPLQPLATPPQPPTPFDRSDRSDPRSREVPGWLAAAYKDPETLQVLIDAGASKDDWRDKYQALMNARAHGLLDSERVLIAYGAIPN
jgi:hypothetical protein